MRQRISLELPYSLLCGHTTTAQRSDHKCFKFLISRVRSIKELTNQLNNPPTRMRRPVLWPRTLTSDIYKKTKKKGGGGRWGEVKQCITFFLGGSPYPTLEPPLSFPKTTIELFPPSLFLSFSCSAWSCISLASSTYLPYSAFSCFLPCKSQPSDHHRPNSGSGIPLSFTATTTYFRILPIFFSFFFSFSSSFSPNYSIMSFPKFIHPFLIVGSVARLSRILYDN